MTAERERPQKSPQQGQEHFQNAKFLKCSKHNYAAFIQHGNRDISINMPIIFHAK